MTVPASLRTGSARLVALTTISSICAGRCLLSSGSAGSGCGRSSFTGIVLTIWGAADGSMLWGAEAATALSMDCGGLGVPLDVEGRVDASVIDAEAGPVDGAGVACASALAPNLATIHTRPLRLPPKTLNL